MTAIKKKMTRLNLPCKLSDQELASYSNLMAEAIRDKQLHEDRLKEASALIKSDIAAATARANACAQKVISKMEYAEVDCEVRFDFDKNIKETIRTDTGESIAKTTISATERQEEFPFEA